MEKTNGIFLGTKKKILSVSILFFLFVFIFSLVPISNLSVQYATSPAWTFITRSGSQLMNNGQPFKFSGANIHWLGLADTNGGTYPSQFRIADALTTAAEMGATVVRSHTLGISVGCSKCIEPSLNVWNDTAFNTIDYAIKVAGDNHVHLLIPLIDNYHFYHGGKHTFTDWEGDANEDDFYSNATVIQDYKNYISHVLNHVNQFTGIALKNDPTIMAWETGSELTNVTGTWSDTWTETIASYIKSVAPNQLVADGHYAEASTNATLTTSQLQVADADMYTDHFYPVQISGLQTNATLASQNNKVYYVGEYDWTDQDTTPAVGSITQDTAVSFTGTESARVDVTKAVTNQLDVFFIQLLSNTFTLTSGQTYTISFNAKSTNNNVIQTVIQKSIAPFTVSSSKTFTLSSSWSAISYTFTPSSTLTSDFLAFNLAQDTGSIWIDNVSISNGVNLITNGDFETSGANWLSPWTFVVKPSLGNPLSSALPAFETTSGMSGDLLWDLYSHADTDGYTKNDAYTLQYPGLTSDTQTREQLLRTHAYTMSGIAPAPAHIIPVAPLLNSVTATAGGNTIDWRGSAGAKNYNVQRSTDGTTWKTIATGITDYNTPWLDTTATGSGYYYRVQPLSLDELKAAFSNILPQIAITPTPTAGQSATPVAIITATIPTPVPIAIPGFSSNQPPQLPITPTVQSSPEQPLQSLPVAIQEPVYLTKDLVIMLRDSTGMPLPHRAITLDHTARTVVTNDEGQAVFPTMSPGNYTASFTYQGLPATLLLSIPGTPSLKKREIVATISVEYLSPVQKLSLLFNSLRHMARGSKS